ncbi:MAG: mannose-6-phosphate isomerase, class I [Frankiaceae bacterium]
MELLDCPIQSYDWGSRTAIARLQGRPQPASGPEAELWVGAHHRAPSLLGDERTLVDRIAADPVGELGPAVVDRFGPTLPFLLKVLGVDAPLSIQVHPDREQAEAGYAAEEASGVPLGAPERNYKDRWPKPELLVALTPFAALCGFRDPAGAARLIEALDVPQLAPVAHCLRAHGTAAVRQALGTLLRWPSTERAGLVEAIAAGAGRLAAGGDPAARWYARLADAHPGDAGVAAALLLNVVELAPGESVVMPTGNLHAYLQGTGVEIMANSDNVLRGGLTSKHVDVDDLLRVADVRACDVPVLRPVLAGDEVVYPAPFDEFRLSAVDVAGRPVALDRRGPQLLLAVAGSVTVRAGDSSLALTGGRAAYVGASEPAVVIEGEGAVFRATPGLPYRN